MLLICCARVGRTTVVARRREPYFGSLSIDDDIRTSRRGVICLVCARPAPFGRARLHEVKTSYGVLVCGRRATKEALLCPASPEYAIYVAHKYSRYPCLIANHVKLWAHLCCCCRCRRCPRKHDGAVSMGRTTMVTTRKHEQHTASSSASADLRGTHDNDQNIQKRCKISRTLAVARFACICDTLLEKICVKNIHMLEATVNANLARGYTFCCHRRRGGRSTRSGVV